MKNIHLIEENVIREKDRRLKKKKSKIFKNIGNAISKYKEEYKYTPLLKRLEKKFKILEKESINLKKIRDYKSILKNRKEKYLIVTINGNFNKELSTLPNNILVKKFSKLDTKTKKEFDKIYQNYDDSNDDLFSSINSIHHEECLSILIDNNTNVDKNISIINFLDSSLVSYIRKLIICKKNAEVSFSEEFINLSAEENFSSSVSEIFLDENSKLSYHNLQKIEKNYHFNSINAFQKRNSVSNFFTFSFSGATIRNNLNIILNDKNCYSNMYGFYAIKKKSHIDNHTSVDHMDENCISNEHYKGIMDEGSNGVFNGKIFVRKKAQKTNAFQANNNILISENAKINTKPQLEIWADDVKCSHGCTVGQLDEDALFYLMSRGISKKDSRALLLSAFSNEIIEKIENKELRKKVEKIILRELKELNHD